MNKKVNDILVGVIVMLTIIVIVLIVVFVINPRESVDDNVAVSQPAVQEYVGPADKFGVDDDKENMQKNIFEQENVDIPGKDVNFSAGRIDEESGLINKYYNLVVNKEFEQAYNMKYNPSMSLEEFKKLYSDSHNIDRVHYLYTDNDGISYVYVYYYDDEYNVNIQYTVQMKVIDDKIKTISSTKEVVKNSEIVAYIKNQDNKKFVILKKNGKENVIAEAAPDDKTGITDLKNLRLINNLLIFEEYGWEYMGDVVYDVDLEKELKTFRWTSIQFTKDNKFLYTCTGAGLGTGPGGVVYRTVDFKKVYELSSDFSQANEFNEEAMGTTVKTKDDKYIMDVTCTYDDGKVIFTLFDNATLGKVCYDLESGVSKVENY